MFVCDAVLTYVHFVNFGFLVDNEDRPNANSCMMVSYGIIFTIAQSTNKRVYFFRKKLSDLVYKVGFDVSCLFKDLFFCCWKKLLRFCQQNSAHTNSLSDVFFCKLIQWQGSHGYPYDLVSVFHNFFYKFCISIMQIVHSQKIVYQSTNVVFGQCSIKITDQNFVIFCK